MENNAIETKTVTDLAEKTSPADTDLFMAGDAGTATLKKVKWSSMLAAIKTKIASWTFQTLNTSDKTIPGALNELNNNSTYSFSGTYAGEVQRRGHIKKLAVSSDAGATAEQNIKICTLPADYLPLKKIEKWIILRGNITALLAINMSGEVNISHISGSVSQGTWISVVETYI